MAIDSTSGEYYEDAHERREREDDERSEKRCSSCDRKYGQHAPDCEVQR